MCTAAAYKQLPGEDLARARFVGLYRYPDAPDVPIPVRELDGRYYDTLGYPVEFGAMVAIIRVEP